MALVARGSRGRSKMFSIGELSKRTGVKIPTIRYDEAMGLIDAPLRSEGNQRRYMQRELERLSFIRHARELKRIEAMSDGGYVDECRVIQAVANHSMCKTKH